MSSCNALAQASFPSVQFDSFDDSNCKKVDIAILVATYFPKNKPSNEVIISFSRQAVILTLECLIDRRYTEIDPLTTSNCCHGMALRVQDLINQSLLFNLKSIKVKIKDSNNSPQIPECLSELSLMYLSTRIRKQDPRGYVSCYVQLKEIESQLTYRNCDVFGKSLQKYFSNFIADSYGHIVSKYTPRGRETLLCDIPVQDWCKYLCSENLRVKGGIRFAPSLYSTIAVISTLSMSKKKVAFLDDIYCPQTGNLLKRYIQLFEGDGSGNFHHIQIKEDECLDQAEPVVIFGGFAISSSPDSISGKLDKLIADGRLTNIMLATEYSYPMYPSTVWDKKSEPVPILPSEKIEKTLIEHSLKYPGVSSSDPSFYMARHYFVSSIQSVISLALGVDKLSLPLTPRVKS